MSESPHEDAGREADLVSEALLTILRVSRVMERVDAGVSPQQYRMLKLIGAGGERSAHLAEKLAVARPTLTSTADSIVAAGLATRQAEPGDRRVVRLYLTEAGRAAIERADAAYAAWFGDVLDYTGGREQILAALAALDQGLTERRRARMSAETDRTTAASTTGASTTGASTTGASTTGASTTGASERQPAPAVAAHNVAGQL